eukprot:s1988_g6.t3
MPDKDVDPQLKTLEKGLGSCRALPPPRSFARAACAWHDDGLCGVGRVWSPLSGDRASARAPAATLEAPTPCRMLVAEQSMEVLHLPCLSAPSTLNVVVVPGNPGIPHLYCSFAEDLQRSLPEDAKMHILGYSNFATETLPNRVATIEEEAESLGDLLEELIDPSENVLLVAHSIGAWCMLRRLQKRPLWHDRRFLAVLAMPFLEIDVESEKSRQRTLRELVLSPWGQVAVPGLANLLTLLPESLKEKVALSQGAEHGSPEAKQLLSTFGKQAHHFESLAFMSISEFNQLLPGSEDSGFFLLKQLAKTQLPLLFLTVDVDTWCPKAHSQRLDVLMQNMLPFAQHLRLGAIPHGFLFCGSHRRAVADAICKVWKSPEAKKQEEVKTYDSLSGTLSYHDLLIHRPDIVFRAMDSFAEPWIPGYERESIRSEQLAKVLQGLALTSLVALAAQLPALIVPGLAAGALGPVLLASGSPPVALHCVDALLAPYVRLITSVGSALFVSIYVINFIRFVKDADQGTKMMERFQLPCPRVMAAGGLLFMSAGSALYLTGITIWMLLGTALLLMFLIASTFFGHYKPWKQSNDLNHFFMMLKLGFF